jgi:hypothetical protein
MKWTVLSPRGSVTRRRETHSHFMQLATPRSCAQQYL